MTGCRDILLCKIRVRKTVPPAGPLLLRGCGILISEKANDPSPSPIGNKFGSFFWFGFIQTLFQAANSAPVNAAVPCRLPDIVFRSEQQFIAQFLVYIQICALTCYRQLKFAFDAHSVHQRFHRYANCTLRRNKFQNLYSLF